MDEFCRKPILNSSYEYPSRHWELGRWAFAEFTAVYRILDDFDATVDSPTQAQLDELIDAVRTVARAVT